MRKPDQRQITAAINLDCEWAPHTDARALGAPHDRGKVNLNGAGATSAISRSPSQDGGRPAWALTPSYKTLFQTMKISTAHLQSAKRSTGLHSHGSLIRTPHGLLNMAGERYKFCCFIEVTVTVVKGC
jgi:hypothetical protein